MPEPRVDFYVLKAPSTEARLKVACRIAEKAYLASQSVLVWHSDRAELETFDRMLWTFSDGSFVPHEWLSEEPPQAPVLLSVEGVPAGALEVLINLDASPDPPPFVSRVARVAEIIDGEPSRRDAGRARFKAYRRMGSEPATHNLLAP